MKRHRLPILLNLAVTAGLSLALWTDGAPEYIGHVLLCGPFFALLHFIQPVPAPPEAKAKSKVPPPPPG